MRFQETRGQNAGNWHPLIGMRAMASRNLKNESVVLVIPSSIVDTIAFAVLELTDEPLDTVACNTTSQNPFG
jgi:hypothetical protein